MLLGPIPTAPISSPSRRDPGRLLRPAVHAQRSAAQVATLGDLSRSLQDLSAESQHQRRADLRHRLRAARRRRPARGGAAGLRAQQRVRRDRRSRWLHRDQRARGRERDAASKSSCRLRRPAANPDARSSAGAGARVGAQIVAIDHETDLAVIKVEAKALPALTFGDSDALRPGQLVLAFGSPLGLDASVTLGIVSAVARQLTPEDPMIYIQTDAPINPGNSGGALVDTDGRLVGHQHADLLAVGRQRRHRLRGAEQHRPQRLRADSQDRPGAARRDRRHRADDHRHARRGAEPVHRRRGDRRRCRGRRPRRQGRAATGRHRR